MTETVPREVHLELSRREHQDIFNTILELDIKSCSVVLYMASILKDEAVPKFARVQITQQLADEFRAIAAQWFVHYRQPLKKADLLFPEYALESKPEDHQIEHFDYAEYDNIAAQIAPLASTGDIELFDEKDKRFIAGLRFYVIVLQPQEGEDVYLFRSYTHSKMLTRSFFMARISDDLYDHIKAFPCQFDGEVDCMCCSNAMFIFNKAHFERMFRFFETLRKNAKETLEEINLRVPIHNFAALVQACDGNLSMLKKVKTIASKDYLKSINIAALRETIKVHNLSVQIIEVDGREHLVYNPNIKEKWELLRLLNDDYLKSLLTGRNYEATSKSER